MTGANDIDIDGDGDGALGVEWSTGTLVQVQDQGFERIGADLAFVITCD